MKIALSLLCVLSAVLAVQGSALSDDQHWLAFKAQHGRRFSDIESKKDAFLAVKASVDQHNAEADQGLHTYYRQVNEFAIMNEEELAAITGTKTVSVEEVLASGAQEHVMSGTVAPASMDLRANKCMTAVQDQRSCGSCWAFASTGALDYRYCTKNNLAAAIPFSQQNLVDCSKRSKGCNGGHPNNAYVDIIELMPSGLESLANYPYTAKTRNCTYNAKLGQAVVTKSTCIWAKPGPDATAVLKDVISTSGPITTSVNANAPFGSYKSGIYTGPCTQSINHAVVLVGYGNDAATGMDYWILRNSWGTGFGMKGYMFIQAGVNMCGIESNAPTYPTL